VSGWEADDCLATIVKSSSQPMTVWSNDQDFFQLEHFPHVTLNGVKRPTFEPRWLQLYKATKGDTSDNIKGIPGFGDKAWEATAPYRAELEAAVIAGTYEGFAKLPLAKAVHTWLQAPGNVQTLQNMLLITHMWQVPEDELNAGITVGTPDPKFIDLTLKRYFL
jgi:hypothetical protein